MDNAHRVIKDCDVLVVDGVITEVGPEHQGTRRRARDRRERRHRHAGHDRHAPPHVADRDARLRRRLDPVAVLRLVLPRARQELPSPGRLRGQPAVGHRGRRRGRHHLGRLVARPADDRPRRRRRRRARRRCPHASSWRYGNIQRAPWEWTADKEFRDFYSRRFDGKGDMLGFQIAFDVVAGPEFPERAAFEVARDLGVSVNTHAGVLGANGDDSIRLMHENGFMTPDTILVHCATLSDDSYQRIAASGCSVSVSTESEQSAGQGYPSSWKLRQFDIPITLSHDTSVWWSADLFTAMRTDARRGSLPPALRGAPQGRDGHPARPAIRGGRRLGDPRRQQGARARRQDRQHRGRQARRHRAAEERRVAGDVPDRQPLRARGDAGAARRRAHRGGRRQHRQARAPADRHRPGQGPQLRSRRP